MVSIQLMIWNRWVAGADATNQKLVINKGTKALPRTRTACQALPNPDKDTGADKARMKFDDPIVWQL